METTTKNIWFSFGAIAAAFGASLCCTLPLAVAFLGAGSAALGAQLEPLRPYFLGLTAVLLGFAFYQVYKPQKVACAPGESCAVPENRRRQRLFLWIVAILAALMAMFPYYVGWIL